jgi:hypothetical protein
MKKIKQLSVFAFAVILMSACQSNGTENSETQKISGEKLLSETSERSMTINFNTVESVKLFNAAAIDVNSVEQIIIKGRESRSQQDREEVVSLMRNFRLAENKNSKLDLELSMSDEPVENGIFLFSVETPKNQSLSLQMYDEEGFEMAASNKIDLKEGKNFKALNVKSLEEGQYLFILKDDAGNELMRKVVIEQQ